MAIRYAVIVAGIAFYAFSITTLIRSIAEENFNKSFFRILDTSENGIISKKELGEFNPCPEFNSKKLDNLFSHYGRNADINDLADDIDSKGIVSMVKACVGDVTSFTDPEHLKSLKQTAVQEEMLEVYDINNDDVIAWGEFNVANKGAKKELPYARTLFRFFDKNHDWKISKSELKKCKVKQLSTYIGSGGKRRK